MYRDCLDEAYFNAIIQDPRLAYPYVIQFFKEYYKIRHMLTKEDWERLINDLLTDLHEEVK